MGTSINCRERPEDKADGAQKPEWLSISMGNTERKKIGNRGHYRDQDRMHFFTLTGVACSLKTVNFLLYSIVMF